MQKYELNPYGRSDRTTEYMSVHRINIAVPCFKLGVLFLMVDGPLIWSRGGLAWSPCWLCESALQHIRVTRAFAARGLE